VICVPNPCLKPEKALPWGCVSFTAGWVVALAQAQDCVTDKVDARSLDQPTDRSAEELQQ
jgi:hypothetical protein